VLHLTESDKRISHCTFSPLKLTTQFHRAIWIHDLKCWPLNWWLRLPVAVPPRAGSKPGCCMVVVPRSKNIVTVQMGLRPPRNVRAWGSCRLLRFGGPYLKGYVKGTSPPLIKSFCGCWKSNMKKVQEKQKRKRTKKIIKSNRWYISSTHYMYLFLLIFNRSQRWPCRVTLSYVHLTNI